ncbi:MAG: hypothetical protein CMJ31_12905 [Phycisphaerae bacterium]|nr:hypothetical protein [Phycisphaerae bacterium]
MHERTESVRREHQRWLTELTAVPTAAGKESRVIAWIDKCLEGREGFHRRIDSHGNIELSLEGATATDTPVYFTAHLDHPAFVVNRVIGPSTIEAEFRGGVMEDYFVGAPVRFYPDEGHSVRGSIVERGDQTDPFKSWVIELDTPSDACEPGVLGVWDLPEPEILPTDTFGREVSGGCIHTPACDDLAALAAALAAFDELRAMHFNGERVPDARVLLTRAEEIGFIGAIGASRDAFMPKDSRIIALETSRSFANDSPIGAGPIVRVGDRVSVFSPGLTESVAKVAEKLAGGPATPKANEKQTNRAWNWQRKLMAGGACEASVFCAYGYEATCVCLPLGNYHNMANLDAVQARSNDAKPEIARECVSLNDYHGMIDLLIACGLELPTTGGFMERVESLWEARKGVLA